MSHELRLLATLAALSTAVVTVACRNERTAISANELPPEFSNPAIESAAAMVFDTSNQLQALSPESLQVLLTRVHTELFAIQGAPQPVDVTLGQIRATRVLESSSLLSALDEPLSFEVSSNVLPAGAQSIVFDSVTPGGPAGDTRTGQLRRQDGTIDPGTRVFIQKHGDELDGEIVTRDSVFELFINRVGNLVLQPQARQRDRVDPPPRRAPDSSSRLDRRTGAATTFSDTCTSDEQERGANVRVGLLYVDPYGGPMPDSVRTLLDTGLRVVNGVFAASGLRHIVSGSTDAATIAHVSVPATTDAGSILSQIQNAEWDSVERWRVEQKLHVVIAVMRDPWFWEHGRQVGICGYATLLPNHNGRPALIVAIDCVLSRGTVAHELGHVFGNEHYRGAEKTPAPIFPDSYGILDSVLVHGKWRLYGDILASGCPEDCRHFQFSSPSARVTLPPRVTLGVPERPPQPGANATRTIARTVCAISRSMS